MNKHRVHPKKRQSDTKGNQTVQLEADTKTSVLHAFVLWFNNKTPTMQRTVENWKTIN